MSTEVFVPALGGDQQASLIAEWYVPDGADVRAGEPVYRLETDFVAIDVEAEADGVLRHWLAAGQAGPRGQVVAVILRPGEFDERFTERDDEAEPLDSHELDDESSAVPISLAAIRDPGPLDLGEGFEPLDEPADAPSVRPGPDGAWASAMSNWARTKAAREEATDDAPEAPRPIPLLRRGLIHAAAPVQAGSAWESVPGDDQAFARPWDGGREQNLHEDLLQALESAEDSWDPLGPPVKAPSDPVLPRTDSVTPLLFRDHAQDDDRWLVEHTSAPVTLTLKVAVRMAESRKMREGLGREWRSAGVNPSDEDIIIRALARAAMEDELLAERGDSIGLVLLDTAEERVAVLPQAARGAFRDAVETLTLARAEADDRACAATVTSFVPYGLEEGTPPLPQGHPFALGIGASRMEFQPDVPPIPIMTMVLAYTPELMAVGQAARLLARVRELLEAPYALFAD